MTELFTCLGGRSRSLRRGCQRLARGGGARAEAAAPGAGAGGGGPIAARLARTRARPGAGRWVTDEVLFRRAGPGALSHREKTG